MLFEAFSEWLGVRYCLHNLCSASSGTSCVLCITYVGFPFARIPLETRPKE